MLAALHLVIIAMTAVLGCDATFDQATSSKPAVVPALPGVMQLTPEKAAAAGIEVRPVVRGQVRTYQDYPATVKPNANSLAHITTLVRGRVTDVLVDLGQDVAAGTLLARLYSSDLGLAQSSYLSANAKFHVAEQAFERAKLLLEEKVIGRAEYQRREGDMLSARAETREARDRLSVLGMTRADIQRLDHEQQIHSSVPVQAPFNGRVISRNVTKGEVLETTRALFTIADLLDVWVIANIPEKDVRLIHRNQAVEVRVSAYPGEVFPGTITYVGDVLDPETRTLRLRVTAPNRDGRLKPEFFAQVRLYAQPEPNALLIAAEAVQQDGKDTIVFVQVDSQQFERRSVVVGDEHEGGVWIRDGVREGELVVTKGALALLAETLRHQLEPAR
jgi:cobalt-zinc-cadmium efflux system membrane fusion protein